MFYRKKSFSKFPPGCSNRLRRRWRHPSNTGRRWRERRSRSR